MTYIVDHATKSVNATLIDSRFISPAFKNDPATAATNSPFPNHVDLIVSAFTMQKSVLIQA